MKVEAVLMRMANLFKDIIEKSKLKSDDIQGIGIGVPGMMDFESGLTTFITNLPGHWINVPVAPLSKKKPAFLPF
jgi:glucokinase